MAMWQDAMLPAKVIRFEGSTKQSESSEMCGVVCVCVIDCVFMFV